jgi:hypothetical protein
MTQPQYMDALDRANELRCVRSVVKRRIRAGELSIATALELECCQRMTVMQILCAQYHVGRRTALRTLSPLRISEIRLVRDLTERQRAVLAKACKPRREAA